jgi:hypothetical protein
MFFKWLRKQLLLAIIGGVAIWVIWHTGDQTSAVVGGPGHYQDSWLVLAAIGAGFVLTVYGSFTRRRDGAFISGLGLILMVGTALWIWGV